MLTPFKKKLTDNLGERLLLEPSTSKKLRLADGESRKSRERKRTGGIVQSVFPLSKKRTGSLGEQLLLQPTEHKFANSKEPSDQTVETLKKFCCNGQSEEVLQVEPGKWLQKCSDGNTPLHVAVVKGHSRIFELIIGSGLEQSRVSSATGFAGRTLLHQACKGGCIELVKVLIEHCKNKSVIYTPKKVFHTCPVQHTSLGVIPHQ